MANALSKIISILVSLLFLVGGLIFFFLYDPAAYDKEGTGTVVDIQEHWETFGEDEQLVSTAYIDYTAEGKTFTHVEYFECDSSTKIGDTVSFYYMSTDPSQIAGSTKDSAPYIGLAFAAVGLIGIVITVIKLFKR